MTGIGHNRGPAMERGASWRRHCWRRARRDLLPQLPLEVVRMRLRRARELGLDYTSYASVRAATGRDIVALLFSSNALRVDMRVVRIAGARADKLRALKRCDRAVLVQPALDPARFLAVNDDLIQAAAAAPGLADGWGAMRGRIAALTSGRGIPGDGVVVIGDTALERDWTAAGRLAGYISADHYFPETLHEL